MTKRWRALLLWRLGKTHVANGGLLAHSLSVEGLPYADIPDRFWVAVRAFRHLRHDVRVKVCQQFLDWHVRQPPKGWTSAMCPSHKQYTWPCPYCMGHWTA